MTGVPNFGQISELCSVEVVTRNESSLPVFFRVKSFVYFIVEKAFNYNWRT